MKKKKKIFFSEQQNDMVDEHFQIPHTTHTPQSELEISEADHQYPANSGDPVKKTFEQVRDFVKKNEKKDLFWRGIPGTEYAENGFVSLGEYRTRINALLSKGKREEALYEMNRTLGNESA